MAMTSEESCLSMMLLNGNSENQTPSFTRAQRIRAAIFPEIFDSNVTNGHALSSAVERLSEPSQLLKNAVIEIINYKEDADITEKALPELIRLLSDDDPITAGQAALILHNLAKKEASRSAMCTATMMQALIQTASNQRANENFRQSIAGVLHCLTQSSQGRLIFMKNNGIALLIKMLE